MQNDLYNTNASMGASHHSISTRSSEKRDVGMQTVETFPGLQTCVSMPELANKRFDTNGNSFGCTKDAKRVQSTTLPTLAPDRKTRFQRLARKMEKGLEEPSPQEEIIILERNLENLPDDQKRRATMRDGGGFSFRTKRASIIEQRKIATQNTVKLLPIEELRQMPAIEAIRQALMARSGGLKDAYAHMDINRSGSVSLNEFQSGMQSLRVDWNAITGKNAQTLFREFDIDGNGELSLEELLGYIPEQEFDGRDTQTMWFQYFNGTSASKSCLARNPRWDNTNVCNQSLDEVLKNVTAQLEWSKHKDAVKRHFKELERKGPSKMTGFSKRDLVGDPKMRSCTELEDVEKVKKEELERTREKIRKIQNVMRDCGRSRKQIVDMQKSIQSVDGSRAKAMEKKQAEKRATVNDLGGPGRKKKGDGVDPMNFAIEISEEDKYIRKIAQYFNISVLDAEEIKKQFDKVDVDKSESIEKPEFETLVKELNKGTEVRQKLIDEWWTMIDEDQSGAVSFDEFVKWWISISGM